MIMPMLTDKSKPATVEDSAPVIPRLLKKAFSPPVTIKNFFKPSFKSSKTEVSAAKGASSSSSSEFSTGKVTPASSNCKVSAGEVAADSSKSKVSTAEVASNSDVSMERIKCSSHNSSHNNPVLVEKASRISCKSGSTTSQATSQCFLNRLPKSGQKRKPNGKSNLMRKDSAKRCKKQENILSSLMSSKQRKECPICKIHFSIMASNEEINDHMDTCLIE